MASDMEMGDKKEKKMESSDGAMSPAEMKKFHVAVMRELKIINNKLDRALGSSKPKGPGGLSDMAGSFNRGVSKGG